MNTIRVVVTGPEEATTTSLARALAEANQRLVAY
jgi:hypothetical protein